MLKNIVIIGSAEEDLRRIEDQLRDSIDFTLATLRLGESLNGNLPHVLAQSDLVILCLRGPQLAALDAIAGLSAEQRPRILVCGEITSPEATRLLVRIGVADLLPVAPTTEELHAAVRRALREDDGVAKSRGTEVISVLGGSGGVGASFIACNLAHLAAVSAAKSVLLIDLDLIYAPITAMLGLKSSRSLADALGQLTTLDALALEGYAARHSSGLRLLTAVPTGVPSRAVSGSDLSMLLKLAREQHDLVVIAANRWLDPASVEAVAESGRVLVVLTQSLGDVRNGLRLRSLLVDWLGVSRASVEVAINRYSTKAPVLAPDIGSALGVMDPFQLPEDVELVRRSIDSATPLLDLAPTAPLTAALSALGARLAGTAPAPTPRSSLQRLFSGMSLSNLSWSNR